MFMSIDGDDYCDDDDYGCDDDDDDGLAYLVYTYTSDLCGTHMYQLVGAPFDFRPQERKKITESNKDLRV
ncbi:hypothetical protein DERP_001318 [Dermatophagoides pteronyssinus]|uniref:Uncharacterized protein n=1 Tax=Dermatophagoides pteronyssinus TaxID=6956 RepID=A0ABQ8JE52_DERPT|nr:hypothetical protein DERP_001318 [Dermatophagoides pteronyssinus]